MSLHPAFRDYLDGLNPLIEESRRSGARPTPASARAALAGLTTFSAPPVPIARVADSALRSRQDGVPVVVPVRIYQPRPEQECDVLLFVHGGGHMAGDLDVYDHSARRIAAATGMVTVSVDYRRSPEAPFPAGLTDTAAVLSALPELVAGIPTTGHVHAIGDSGGAAKLASIAMRAAAGDAASPIERQVLLYPSLDYTMSGASIERYGTGYFLEADRIRWYFDNYFAGDEDRDAASPLSGPFAPTMPQTLVIAAEYDPLLSEAESYVDRMKAAGAEADLVVAPGMIHAFAFFETLVPREVDRLYAVAAEFLATGHAGWEA